MISHCPGFIEMVEIRGLSASGPLAGHGGADYCVRENLTNDSDNSFAKLSLNKKTGIETAAGRPSGRRHTSQPGAAHAAGAEPPGASKKNRKCTKKCTEENSFEENPFTQKHHDGGVP